MDLNPNSARRLQALTPAGSSATAIRFSSDDGVPVTVSACGAALRLRVGASSLPDYGLLQTVNESALTVTQADAHTWRISVGELALELSGAPLRATLFHQGHAVLRPVTDEHFRGWSRLPCFGRMAQGWTAGFALATGESVYGLGEKFGPLDKRGQLIHSYVEDALGVNTGLSYKNATFCWSVQDDGRGWGLLANTPGTVHWGVGQPDWSHRSLALIVEDETLDLLLFAGEPAQILSQYTAITGRAPAIPLWGLGVWFSRAYYKSPQEAEQVAARLRAEQVPCDVITLDGRAAWEVRTRFDFVWDPARFPDPPEQIAAIKKHGLRVCVWEYPLVSVHSPSFPMLAEKGWLLKTRDGKPYVYEWDTAPGSSPFGNVLTPLAPSGIFDFTHPDAFVWWRDQHKRLFDDGIDVIKSDFGEQVPRDAVAHNGDAGRRLHSIYPLLYNQCVYEATKKFGRGAPMVWGRAGWTGSQRYPIQWGGDPQSDWEGMAASIRGGLSWGMSGVPFHSSDIGGFYGARQPDAELFIRWMQWSVYSSHMRFHGIGEREPWWLGDEVKAVVLNWLRWRYRLLPYLHALCDEASRTGLPVMRAMALAFPRERWLRAFETQFMCGDALLVAPIVAPGGAVSVALPPGRWFDLDSAAAHEGGRVLRVEVSRDVLPVFGRDGHVLPLGREVDRADAIDPAKPLNELWLFGAARYVVGRWSQLRLDASGEVHLTDTPIITRRFDA